MKKIIKEGSRTRVQTIYTKPTRTQQQFKEQCDVNHIISRYKKTGEIMHLNRRRGVYADLTHITDYASSLQKVLDANSAFQTLPAALRARFENDPAQLLNFLQNPNNHDEGVELGLFEDPKQQNPEQPKTNDLNEKKPNTTKKPKQLDLEKPEPE